MSTNFPVLEHIQNRSKPATSETKEEQEARLGREFRALEVLHNGEDSLAFAEYDSRMDLSPLEEPIPSVEALKPVRIALEDRLNYRKPNPTTTYPTYEEFMKRATAGKRYPKKNVIADLTTVYYEILFPKFQAGKHKITCTQTEIIAATGVTVRQAAARQDRVEQALEVLAENKKYAKPTGGYGSSPKIFGAFLKKIALNSLKAINVFARDTGTHHTLSEIIQHQAGMTDETGAFDLRNHGSEYMLQVKLKGERYLWWRRDHKRLIAQMVERGAGNDTAWLKDTLKELLSQLNAHVTYKEFRKAALHIARSHNRLTVDALVDHVNEARRRHNRSLTPGGAKPLVRKAQPESGWEREHVSGALTEMDALMEFSW